MGIPFGAISSVSKEDSLQTHRSLSTPSTTQVRLLCAEASL